MFYNEIGREYIQVVGTGSKNWGQALNELYSLIDYSKITTKSSIICGDGSTYQCMHCTNGGYIFSRIITYSNTGTITSMHVYPNSTFGYRNIEASKSTYYDITTTVLGSGYTVTLYY